MPVHLYDLLRQRADRYPNAVAVGGQQGLVWKTLRSRELLDLVDRLAAELAELGVREGDRVVYWVPNHWRTPVYLFATWKLGAIAVPFDREMNPEGGARILASVDPPFVVGGYGEQPAWAEQAELTEWWEPGSRSTAAPPTTPWTRPTEPLAVIVFTSGTTGAPKGCMIGHTNLCTQAEAVAERVPIDPSCRLASILPLSHLMELATLLYAITSGAATHYVPSRRPTDIERVLQEQRVTHMVVVPQVLEVMARSVQEGMEASAGAPAFRALLRTADRLPMAARRRLFWPIHRRLGGHLRLMLVGGAALAPETQLFWERLGVRVILGFGTTECSPVVTLGEPDGCTPLGSTGRSIRDVEIKLSERGEVLVRGPNVMQGYWRDPDRTAEVMRDGWYATGDLGSIDAEGNLRIVGRARDLIVLPSGMNVWPQDVEDVLRGHPTIKDAAVLAVPTARGGATLHAYLIPASATDRAADVGQIVAACNARLAQHQRIATASWWEGRDFPRTQLLKIKRHLLPVPTADRVTEIEAVLPSDDPVGQALGGLVHQPAVRPDQTLAELGIDSLGLVELAVALEDKTGRTIDEDSLRTEMTVEQVRAVMAAAPLDETARGGGRIAPRGIGIAPPLWVYTWGRRFRALSAPFDVLLRWAGAPIAVLGADHLGGLPNQVILAGTHRSFADLPLVRYALARSGRRDLLDRMIAANAAGPNFAGGFAWYGALAFGLHPIDQRHGRETSLRALVRAAQAGRSSVLIFPQGTHTTRQHELADDPLVRFRAGVAHLAAALDVPVVPFGLAGSERMIPPSSEGFHGPIVAGIPVSVRRGPLAIAFGAPLTLTPGEPAHAFVERLQRICYALTDEAERAIAPASGASATRGAVIGVT